MKKTVLRACAFTLLAIMLTGCFSGCTQDPYQYDLSEYITVPTDLTGITVTDEEIAVGVAERISSALYNKAEEVTVVERGAAIGDTVTVGFAVYHLDTYAEDRVSGKKIEEISDPSCIIRIGDGKHPQKLSEALIGKKAGDTFAVSLTLPSSYKVNSLAGKSVVYEGMVGSVKERVLPEYGDAFVQSVSACTTVAEYEEMLEKTVRQELIFEKLLALCTFNAYPVEEVNQYSGNFISYYTDLAQAAEISLEDYVARKFFVELNDFHLQADAYAKETVGKELLIYSLSRTYSITVSDQEYTERARVYASQYGLASVSALESKFGKDYVMRTVQTDKVLEYLESTLVPAEASEPVQ